MAFDVEEFKAKLNEVNGLIPASRFDVMIMPKSDILRALEPGKFVRFLAFSVDIPGISFSPDLVFLNGHGRINEVPIRTNISDCEIQFYLDNNNMAYKFLYNWMNVVAKFDGVYYKSPKSENVRDYGFDEMEYADEYYSDVYIRVLKDTGETLFTTQLVDAFPMELPGINFDWNNQDILATAQIRLGFRAMKNSLVYSGAPSLDN
jgi:hypothetical protein